MSYDDDVDGGDVETMTDGGQDDPAAATSDAGTDDEGDGGAPDGTWAGDDGGAAAVSGSDDIDAFALASDGSGMQSAIAGFDDPASDADPQRARVVGWNAVCMFVFDGGRRCNYMGYSVDQDGAQAKANSHIASFPDHRNAVVVSESK